MSLRSVVTICRCFVLVTLKNVKGPSSARNPATYTLKHAGFILCEKLF